MFSNRGQIWREGGHADVRCLETAILRWWAWRFKSYITVLLFHDHSHRQDRIASKHPLCVFTRLIVSGWSKEQLTLTFHLLPKKVSSFSPLVGKKIFSDFSSWSIHWHPLCSWLTAAFLRFSERKCLIPFSWTPPNRLGNGGQTSLTLKKFWSLSPSPPTIDLRS